MGKQRRKRISFHTPPLQADANTPTNAPTAEYQSIDSLNTASTSFTVPDDLFANVNMNFTLPMKSLNDETQSNQSFKSTKSNKQSIKKTCKKDKLRLRRELLLQRIDALNQQKKEAKIRYRKKKLPVIGDTTPLLDALPALKSLKESFKPPGSQKCPKGIHKTSKRKKEAIRNLQIYKAISKNKAFIANPLQAITQHIRAVVEEANIKENINKKKVPIL